MAADCIRHAKPMHLPETPPPGIALYDMDGTLLAWDCQLLFRHHVIKAEPLRWFSVPLFLAFLPFAKLLGTENMKRIFHCFLWKMPRDHLSKLSRSFAQTLTNSIYAEPRASLETHKQSGHLTILSSASPECYVSEVGELLGFGLSLGTVLENDALFPDLTNHKGAEKIRRLREILPSSYFEGKKLVSSHGYTDSTADLPLLDACKENTVVNPKPALTALAEANGWTIIRPKRPWDSPQEKAWRVLLLLFAIGKNPAKL